LYTRRGREKTQEEFAGADKGADGQKVPFWDGRQTGGTPVVFVSMANKGVMKQKVQKRGQRAK